MTSLSRRLAWRELSTHKIRSGVAIALFALPIMVICAFTNAMLGFSAQSYDRGRLPSTYADISNTVCSEDEEKDATWCVRDREELEKPDIERIKNLVPEIADTFIPVWQLETSVASSYGADIRLALKTSPQAKNEPQVPARGEIALSDTTLSLLGKRVGEKVKFTPWAGAQPLTLTIAERTDDRSTNVMDGVAKAVGVLNKEDINVAQFGRDSELVSARLPQGVSVEWESPRIVDQAVSQEEKGVSIHSVERVIPSRYSSFLVSYVDVEFLMFVSVGALAVILVSSIVGTVFAVAARRSIRSTGLLAAVGADPRQLRKIMLWQGALVGLLGSLLGTVAGLFLGMLLPWGIEGVYVFGFAWDIALLSVAVAVIAGLCAAMLPAIRSASMEPVQALAEGASTRIVRLRPLYFVGPALGILGLISIVLSKPEQPIGVWAVMVIIGAIISAPATILFLAKLGRRMPLSMRLGLRDALRSMSRTGPAVGAITGTMMICVFFFLSVTGSADLRPQVHVNAIRITANEAVASDSSPYEAAIRKKQAQHSAPLRVDEYASYYSSQRGSFSEINVLPPSKEVPDSDSTLSLLDSFSSFNNWDNEISVYVVTPSVISMLADSELKSLDKKVIDRLEQTIVHGGAVAFNPDLVESGKISVDIKGKTTDKDGNHHELLAMAVPGARTNAVVVSPETARSLGAEAVFRASYLVGGSELSWWEKLNPDYSGDDFANVMVSKQSTSHDRFEVAVVLFLSWVLCFGLILLLVALASFETRREVITMFSLGGEKKLIRRFSAMQGLFVALTGAVGAMVWLFALERAELIRLPVEDDPFRGFDIPWIMVAVYAVGVVFVGWLTGYAYGIKRGRDYDSLVPRR